MSWANLDDGFADHPKVIDLPDAAFRLHVCAMCWCSRRLTDGLVRSRELRILGAMLEGCPDDQRLQELAQKLVDARLWDPCEEGWRLHDWLKHNESAQKVIERREAAKQRMAENRKGKGSEKRAFAGSSRERSEERAPERSREVRVPSPLLSSPLPIQDPKSLSNESDSAPAAQAPVSPAPGLPGIDPGTQQKPSKAPKTKRAGGVTQEVAALAIELLGELNAARRRVKRNAPELAPTPENVRYLQDRLMAGTSPDVIRHVIAVREAQARHDEKSWQFFNAVSPFRPDNFAYAAARTVEDAAKPDRARGAWRDPTVGSNTGQHTPEQEWDAWRRK